MATKQLKMSVSAYFDDGVMTPPQLSVLNRYKTIATGRPHTDRQSILTTATAILLGASTSLGGTLMLVNYDVTNFVTIYRDSGLTHAMAILRPDADGDGHGGFLFVDALGADWLAPYGKADTAACEIGIFSCPP